MGEFDPPSPSWQTGRPPGLRKSTMVDYILAATKLLEKEEVAPKVAGMFYQGIVASVLLYGGLLPKV